jgi:light-regulated signal transduction histidine kinase (bacteriophytochrome)
MGKQGKVCFIIHAVTDVTDFFRLTQKGVGQNTLAEELRTRTRRMEAEIDLRAQEPQAANDRPRTLNEDREITERKEGDGKIQTLNRDLQQRAAQLESANKELEAFSVSHDLRSPLRHIAGFVELLEKRSGAELDPISKRYLGYIADAARQMGSLIDDLLSFSRMGRSEMRACHVDLKKLTEEVIQQVAADTAGREISWKIGALPEIQADPALLRQVLVNLLSNALKYSRTRPRSEIEVGCQPDCKNERVFFVRDNGVGFDMKYASRLFGLFQRLHESDQFEGTGVGLATVQRIIARHGGRIGAEAALDRGATFYFSIPKHQQSLT